MENNKVSAIVPAFNEEARVANVLKVLLSSKYLDEVVLVDDGSTDNTAKIGKQFGAKVILLPENMGKARAMREGLKSTDADVIVFFDADLVGLKETHIISLLKPVIEGRAVMCVGIRDRWWGLPKIMYKIFPVFFAIAGERSIKREVLHFIPEKFVLNMTDGIVMNYYCKINRLPVEFVYLPGLDIVIKEKKRGMVYGLAERLKMIIEFIKVRIMVFINKEEFKNKNVI